MPIINVLSEPISQSILDPDDPSYALSPKLHDDPRNLLRQPKHRSHEDQKDYQEVLQQWLECMKNSYAIVKNWMDKDEALWVQSKLGLDSNGEFKSIPFTNMTHLSLEVLDKTNPRDTNPWEILDFSPMDIHEESPLELKKEDYIIDGHESYIVNISSNLCSYEKSPELIGLSTTTHEIFNPLILCVPKDFERVVVDAYAYHKYCRSRLCES
jgi:hypothetical protein